MDSRLPSSFTELPPRARRIHVRVGDHCVLGGTTSACAENTVCGGLVGEIDWNYLRVRGEYLNLLIRHLDGEGTTSACAENTACARNLAANMRNYLRVRGEYQSRLSF